MFSFLSRWVAVELVLPLYHHTKHPYRILYSTNDWEFLQYLSRIWIYVLMRFYVYLPGPFEGFLNTDAEIGRAKLKILSSKWLFPMIMTLPHRLSFLSPLLTEVSLSATASYITLQKGDFTKQLTNRMTTKVCLKVHM